jgi:hypothetical protein
LVGFANGSNTLLAQEAFWEEMMPLHSGAIGMYRWVEQVGYLDF